MERKRSRREPGVVERVSVLWNGASWLKCRLGRFFERGRFIPLRIVEELHGTCGTAFRLAGVPGSSGGEAGGCDGQDSDFLPMGLYDHFVALARSSGRFAFSRPADDSK